MYVKLGGSGEISQLNSGRIQRTPLEKAFEAMVML